ncbi:hypothetical protein ACFWPK_04325 [Nocardia sp. NPDC058519]|uniref:hypothetical protein n=1 Tax=Nocardia sp. NPDC058519 TaxID=3346535 RepID=UPI003665F6CB
MIPTPFTVQHYTFVAGAKDAHGNPIVTYTPLLTAPGIDRKVAGWSGASTAEPPLAGHDRVVVDLELMVPKGFPARARDKIRIADPAVAGLYEVVGDPRDFTASPFNGPLGRGWGYVLTLRRVDG